MKNLQNIILPIRCLLCQNPSNQKIALCETCETQLPKLKNTCQCCASILPDDVPKRICGLCIKNPPYFYSTIALFAYEGKIIKLITGLKFHQELNVAILVADLFSQHLINEKIPLPDIIIPVPLHNKRLRNRGYNQALEIAKPIAKKFNIPLLKNACLRKRHTKPQIELPAHSRKQNIKNAFEIKTPMNDLKIAIVDDVMTTGNTVNELSKDLMKSGAKKVEIWCIARTLSLPRGMFLATPPSRELLPLKSSHATRRQGESQDSKNLSLIRA